jgi:hypothetical protein
MCDDWKVGCRWHVTVDGIVLDREGANLAALATKINTNGAGIPIDNPLTVNPLTDPMFEQFDHGPGGRVTFISQVGCGWDIQAAYEGVPEWNASVVYPKQVLPDIDPPLPPIYPPNPPGTIFPPEPFPEGTEQRSLHYRTDFHSGELNFVRGYDPTWRFFCGVRYIQFDDEINDTIDQQAQPPLPGPRDAVNTAPAGATPVLVFPPIGPVATTDRLNLIDVENDLMGFQIGLLHDTWRLNRRFAIEGFLNSGVYYNKIKYTNLMRILTTQEFADNTNTVTIDESRIDVSETVNNDVRELSEICYVAEASISSVCRLNKCWAMRAGYQVLWISNLHLAEDAFLNTGIEERDMLFHGWHAGIECRR